jgi:serine/threonine protein kinase
MQQVDHPNIVKYYETYEDKKFIYLCMELMTGGELIDKKNTVSEENAAFYFARVVKAI